MNRMLVMPLAAALMLAMSCTPPPQPGCG